MLEDMCHSGLHSIQWDAWEKKKGLTQEEAKKAYIEWVIHLCVRLTLFTPHTVLCVLLHCYTHHISAVSLPWRWSLTDWSARGERGYTDATQNQLIAIVLHNGPHRLVAQLKSKYPK